MNDNHQLTQPSLALNSTSSATFQTLIPTKNKPALIGYYFGIFGLLPFIGLPLAIVAVILGIRGLLQFKPTPTPGAKGHAITALILGGLQIVCFAGFLLFITAYDA